MEQTAVTSIRWIPRGVAQTLPKRDEVLTQSHLSALAKEIQEFRREEIDKSSNLSLRGRTKNHLNSQGSASEDDTASSESEYEQNLAGYQFFSTIESDLPKILNDPYLKRRNQDEVSEEEEIENDAQLIRDTDFLLIAASADTDSPSIDIFVYDHETTNFYVHHEITIGIPPLCIERLESIPSQDQKADLRNYCAVGYYGQGAIEIWNLDIVDQLEPSLILGCSNKFDQEEKEVSETHHTNSVLTLHKHPSDPYLLLSGGADNTVRLWNLEAQESCVSTYRHHQDKVQIVRWHPVENSIALSAGYDKDLTFFDARKPSYTFSVSIPNDDEIEQCLWNIHQPTTCYVALESGFIHLYDMRKMSNGINGSQESLLWKQQLHDKACTSISQSSIPELLVTASVTGTSKVWKLEDTSRLSLVTQRDLKAGPILSIDSNPDLPSVFAFGAMLPVIWDISESEKVSGAFGI